MRSAHSSLRTRLAVLGLGLATAAATAVGATGAANAAPAPVKYEAKLVGKTVQLDVTNGTVAVANDRMVIKNNAGQAVLSYPLFYSLDGKKHPIAATTKGQQVTLVPQNNVALTTQVERRIRGPQTRQERDDQALARFTTQMSSSISIGSIIGLAAGAAIGCVVGLLGFVVGCLAGLPIGATVGAIGGTIASGAPIIEYWNQYNRTIRSPFKPQYY